MKKRALVCLTALAMFFSLAYMPGGEASAAGLTTAKVPAKYKSGYYIYKGIDISNHQGVIPVSSYKTMKSMGITHVIVRSSYTRLKKSFQIDPDKSFKQNVKNAYAAGMKVGVYHFSQAKTVAEAKKEAAYTLKMVKPVKSRISMPVVFDYEFNSRLTSKYARSKGRDYMTKIACAFCDKVKAAGYSPMVYASASFYTGYVNRDTLHKKYPIWVAHYTRNGKATDYARTVAMWQYTSSCIPRHPRTNKCLITGGVKRVDMNYVFIKKGTHKSWMPGTAKATSSKKTVSKAKKFKVKTKCPLNVRKGPAKSYKKVDTLKKGKKVTIVKTKNGWGKIKNYRWINLKYTKRL